VFLTKMNVNAQTFELLPRKGSAVLIRKKKIRTMSESRAVSQLRDFRKVTIELPAIRLSTPSTNFHPMAQEDTPAPEDPEDPKDLISSEKIHLEILHKIDTHFLRHSGLKKRLKSGMLYSSTPSSTYQDRPFSSEDSTCNKVNFKELRRRMNRSRIQSSYSMLQPYFNRVVVRERKPNSFDADSFLRRRMMRSPGKIKEMSSIYSSNMTLIH
jgi:hypothetical protein